MGFFVLQIKLNLIKKFHQKEFLQLKITEIRDNLFDRKNMFYFHLFIIQNKRQFPVKDPALITEAG